jgi:hypothetical protein
MRKARLFSYVVHHDTGHAPNPYFGVCTLCRCKYKDSPRKPQNVVELAMLGDWIVGTGGADKKKSAGHHKLVYAMKVEKIITRDKYFRTRTFACKKPSGKKGDFRFRGDNLEPTNRFEKKEQYALISKKHFYYFGENAIPIPRDKFPHLEKKGPGFRSDFDGEYVKRFENWMTRHKTGKHGDPWMQKASKERRAKICKSSC